MNKETSELLDQLRHQKRLVSLLRGVPFQPHDHFFSVLGSPCTDGFTTSVQASVAGRIWSSWMRMCAKAAHEEVVRSLPIGLSAYGLLSPCKQCGLDEFMLNEQGLRPVAPCPFKGHPHISSNPSVAARTTVVHIEVPSGRLVVGCTLAPLFFPGKREMVRDPLAPFFSHHGTELWATHGFLEADIGWQEYDAVFRVGDGEVVLTKTEEGASLPQSLARVNTIMPLFAAADANLFRRVRHRLAECRSGMTYRTVHVRPGRYEVRVNYEHAPVLIPRVQLPSGERVEARVAMKWVGEATALPTNAKLRENFLQALAEKGFMRQHLYEEMVREDARLWRPE